LSPDIIGINISSTMRRVRHVAERGEKRNAYEIMGGKPEEEMPFAISRSRWEDNIHMDPKERGWEVWTGCGWLRTGTSGGGS
jgi:hypothetical protein